MNYSYLSNFHKHYFEENYFYSSSTFYSTTTNVHISVFCALLHSTVLYMILATTKKEREKEKLVIVIWICAHYCVCGNLCHKIISKHPQRGSMGVRSRLCPLKFFHPNLVKLVFMELTSGQGFPILSAKG